MRRAGNLSPRRVTPRSGQMNRATSDACLDMANASSPRKPRHVYAIRTRHRNSHLENGYRRGAQKTRSDTVPSPLRLPNPRRLWRSTHTLRMNSSNLYIGFHGAPGFMCHIADWPGRTRKKVRPSDLLLRPGGPSFPRLFIATSGRIDFHFGRWARSSYRVGVSR